MLSKVSSESLTHILSLFLFFFFINNGFHYKRKNTTMTNLKLTIEPLLSRDLKNTTTPNSMPPYTPIQMENMMICDLVDFSLFPVEIS